MAISDPANIIGTIDAALYRINDRTVNDIIPFTYRDSLTYANVLERIRKAVIDVLEYCNAFGDEQDEIITKLNKTVTTFIADVEAKHAQWDNDLIAKKKDVEATIEDFKSRLIKAEFRVNGDFITAPLMGGGTIDLVSKSGFQSFTSNVARADAQINSRIDGVYTKAESDDRYVLDLKRTNCVIFGSSNATTSTSWASDVARDNGLYPYNFAIGGGALTSHVSTSFDTQLNNAVARLDEAKRNTTGWVYVCDLLNDIRSLNPIRQAAESFFARVRESFPNAKIAIVPVIYNNSTLNRSIAMVNNISVAIQIVSEVSAKYGAIIAEGSQSWFHEGPNAALVTDRGPNDVHLTAEGYQRCRYYFNRFLNGGSAWRNFGMTNLSEYGTNSYPLVKSGMDLYVGREGSLVTISGTVSNRTGATGDTVIWNIPRWAEPYRNVYFWALRDDRASVEWYVNTDSQLATASSMDSTVHTYLVNAQYRIW